MLKVVDLLKVRASFLEVYNEEVRDLLGKRSKKPLEVREHRGSGVYIKGLTAVIVKSEGELEKVFEVSCDMCLSLQVVMHTMWCHATRACCLSA